MSSTVVRRKGSESVVRRKGSGSGLITLNRRQSKSDDDPSRIWEDLPKKYRSKKRGAYIRRHTDYTITSNYQRFKLLMWKNYIVTKRRWKLSLLQFCAPIFLVTVLVIYITNNPGQGHSTKIYEPFKVDEVPTGTLGKCDTIYLWPQNSKIDELRQHLENRVSDDGIHLKTGYYKSSVHVSTPKDACVLIEFRNESWGTNGDTLPYNISYDIRFSAVYHTNNTKSALNIGKQWDTPFFHYPKLGYGAREPDSNTGEYPGYYEHGFLYFQHILALQLIEMMMIQEASHYNISRNQVEEQIDIFWSKIVVRLCRYPFSGHESDVVTITLSDYLPIYLIVGFGISSFVMVYLSVREKEMGTRALLLLYGVNNVFHKLTWILHNWVFLCIVAAILTIILSTRWTTSLTGVYILSEKYLSEMFFLLLFCYIFNIVCFTTFISYLFNSASTACISLTLLGTLMYLPYLYIKPFISVLTGWETMFATISPHAALGMGLIVLADLQSKSDRKGWENLFKNQISIGWICVSMLVTGFIQINLTMYVSRVFPEKGMPRTPWNFCIKSWFWKNRLPPTTQVPPELLDDMSYEELHPEYFEKIKDIKNRKEFYIDSLSKYTGWTLELFKVNLEFFEDYVTVILGDEGSGKSLLFNIITGSRAPSSGTVYLGRKDLTKHPNVGQALIGYCPPENRLIPDLTVDETLHFFSDLKGISNRIDAYEEVERFLKITTLKDCRDVMVCDLTHSARRLLMVATAFIGGSRIILLDDPTLNFSATQQRVLWDFIAQEKKHRTIVAAMSSINEVDSTADTIVMLENGQVTARGSPDFLEQTFGGGFHLELNVSRTFEKNKADKIIQEIVAGSFLQKKSPDEQQFDYYLPASQTSSFSELLNELEHYKESYGIEYIRIRAITLDEVYLSMKRMQSEDSGEGVNVTDNDTPIAKIKKIKRIASSTLSARALFPKAEKRSDVGTLYFLTEFRIMFLKNARYTYRHKVVGLLSTLAPLVMLMMIHFITLRLELPPEPVRRRLDINDYWRPHIITDMAEATNEGVFLRDSVTKMLKNLGINQTDYTYEDSIIDVILQDQDKVDNENDMCNIALHLFQSKELLPKSNATGGSSRDKTIVKVGITGYFNNQPLHTPAAALSFLHNTLLYHIQSFLKRKLTRNLTRQEYHLDISNYPLHYQPVDRMEYAELLTGPGYLFGVFVTFAYCFHFPFFIITPVKEQDFRHIQIICGANKIIFWGANYLWNFIHFTVVVILHLSFLSVAGIPGFRYERWDVPQLLWSMFIFLEVYGATCIALIGIVASSYIQSWGKAFAKLAMFFILTGPVTMVLVVQLFEEKTIMFVILHNFLLLFPSYSFGTGMFYIVVNGMLNTECEHHHEYTAEQCNEANAPNIFDDLSHTDSVVDTCCFNRKENPYSFSAYGIGKNIVTLLLVCIGSILVKVFFYSKRYRNWQKDKLDKKVSKWNPVRLEQHEIKNFDVLAEQAKVYKRTSGEKNDDTIIIRNLTLETRSCIKVDNICLKFESGECFAILGTNRAGKSTLLKLISGCVMPTFGDVEYNGLSLMKDYDEYLNIISFCPDRSPFMEHLTCKEILELVGTLRKMSPKSIKSFIEHVEDIFDMKSEMKRQIKKCSYIVKKKLTALASLMGEFKILLLTNPTSHLDWKSRQMIRANVKRLMDDGCIVIWGADGIEHCESICTKVSIMVNGHLRCLGSLSHLRDLYEKGFTIVVKFSLDRDLIYFTSKKQIWMENEMRENEIDEETGLPVYKEKYEQRKSHLKQVLNEDIDVEKALDVLSSWEQNLMQFIAFFGKSFPNAIMLDKQPGFLHYHVNEGDETNWGDLFEEMEEAKVGTAVESYYVCCTSLEQVYFNFTRGQKTVDLEN